MNYRTHIEQVTSSSPPKRFCHGGEASAVGQRIAFLHKHVRGESFRRLVNFAIKINLEEHYFLGAHFITFAMINLRNVLA